MYTFYVTPHSMCVIYFLFYFEFLKQVRSHILVPNVMPSSRPSPTVSDIFYASMAFPTECLGAMVEYPSLKTQRKAHKRVQVSKIIYKLLIAYRRWSLFNC